MGVANNFFRCGYLVVLLLFLWFPANDRASAETNQCLKCHKDVWQEEMAKRYIHKPFIEKNCIGCHGVNNLSSRKQPSSSSSGEDPANWTGKNLIPSTSHWFEFESTDFATMILEASYESIVRLYREISLPPLDDLSDVKDVFGRYPPIIYEVEVLEVEKGIFLSATIRWHTDRPTRFMLNYGINDLRHTTPLSSKLQTEHYATLSELKSGQEYEFIITAEDGLGNKTKSEAFNFSTAKTFSNPYKEDCCLVKPLGLDTNFFRKGDRYMVNITTAQPVKLFFALLRTDCSLPEASNRPQSIESQSQKNRHVIVNAGEVVTLVVCRSCHQTSSCNHPVNIYPNKEMEVPVDYPTMDDGRLSCISCHAPHASDFQYRVIKGNRQELCTGCHNKFKPTEKHLLTGKSPNREALRNNHNQRNDFMIFHN